MTRFIARNISRKLGVRKPDFKSVPELIDEIQSLDSATYDIMDKFLKTYHEWFNFHKRIDQQGNQGNLSSAETEELTNLIQQRDSIREELLERINNLP
jgi:hypothetical protein